MTPDNPRGAADSREMIGENVRRIVGIAALRRIHKLISDRDDEERILRKVVAPVAAVVMIVVAALIWHFAGPYTDDAQAPLPECAPPKGEMIST